MLNLSISLKIKHRVQQQCIRRHVCYWNIKVFTSAKEVIKILNSKARLCAVTHPCESPHVIRSLFTANQMPTLPYVTEVHWMQSEPKQSPDTLSTSLQTYIRHASFPHLWSVTVTPNPIKCWPITFGYWRRIHFAGSAGDLLICDKHKLSYQLAFNETQTQFFSWKVKCHNIIPV